MVDLNIPSLSDAVAMGANDAVQKIILFVPNLVISVILLLVGYFVSIIVGRIIQTLLDQLQIESAFKKYRIEDALGGNQVTPILATLTRWYVLLIFLQLAVASLQLEPLTGFINQVLLYVPVIFGVLLLIISAAIVGEWMREAILDLKKFYLQYTIAQAVKWVLIIMAIVVGLETVGFKMEFVREVLTLLLQGIVYGVAIAFGLAFGLGGQKDASDLIKKVRKGLDI
ncbi:Uncharacterised protein [uncultured archaeon]|nr:Uncharacterised protein [uncultured archaeon]